MGREAVFVGALPAHLSRERGQGQFLARTEGVQEREDRVKWTFPPPPRIGHIKDIVLDGDRCWWGSNGFTRCP